MAEVLLQTGARPVTVGVDGSPAGLTALDLAVREATRRNRPLRLVYADQWASHPARVDTDPVGELAGVSGWRPEDTLCPALARVAGAAVPVSAELVAGGPTRALLRESTRCALLIVGHRRRGGASDLLLGSVALSLTSHAVCPVLIATGRPDPDGEVVAGLTGRPDSDDAVLEFALAEASLRGTDLIALHAWQGHAGELDDLPPAVYPPGTAHLRAARMLADTVGRWRDKYPEVTVRARLVRATAGHALSQASTWAQLVVVGTGRLGVPGIPFRSVRHALLRHAQCPIAVVPAGAPLSGS